MKMEQVIAFAGILCVFSTTIGKVEGVTCKDCHDVDKPANCRPSFSCGDGEICSTEEFIDSSGLTAYRLGCANAERCRLFLNAKTLFGKREISPKCYECCETDDCNVNLCQSSGGHMTDVTTTSPPTEHHTCPPQVIHNINSGCPPLFVPFQSKCYLIGPGSTDWMTAKQFCRRHGGNLVSLHSDKEHSFLKEMVNQVNASFIPRYWTGGFYSHEAGEMEYIDGSPFNYSHWKHGTMQSGFSKGYMYYVVLNNPVGLSGQFKDLPMLIVNGGKGPYGIICEINRSED